jgi:hypothetical protein
MAKPDLNKLKTEIESRKKERNMTPSALGESAGYGVAPRDVFLNGLITSLKTGQETASTNLVKVVENKVAVKKGENTKMRVNEQVIPQQQPQPRRPIPPINETVDMSPERDEQMYRDMQRGRGQTMVDAMSEYMQVPTVGSPMRNQPQQMPMYNGAPMLNEQYLAENVKKIVNNYLAESLAPIFEEAMKETMLEMYALDRIKTVLRENKDFVKTLVYEVVKEIKEQSKNKAQS